MSKTWGGKRAGGGRPSGTGRYGVQTKPIRIPENMISAVMRYVEHKGFSLPLYSSSVQAGFPSPADDHLETHLDLNSYLIKNPNTTFFARVAGDSMINAGISEDDLLVVDRSLIPEHGKIVIAVVNGELTVKRLHKTAESCMLVAENPNYPSIVISGEEGVHIWGVVINVIKSF